jgi:hypothetical protein
LGTTISGNTPRWNWLCTVHTFPLVACKGYVLVWNTLLIIIIRNMLCCCDNVHYVQYNTLRIIKC